MTLPRWLLAPLLPLALVAACAEDPVEPVGEPTWHVTVAAELGEKLGGVTLGDVDPGRPGDEIVVVAQSGAVHLITYDGSGFSAERIATAPGEAIAVAVGELDPGRPGEEIVIAGMAVGGEEDGGEGAAHVLFRDGDDWTLREITRSAALLHAVTIADVDPETPGNEVVTAGFAQEVEVLAPGADGWSRKVVANLGGAAKSAVPHQGGVAIACTDGSVVLVRQQDGTWTSEVVDRAPAGQARIASDDERLLLARDDGALALLDGGTRADIYSEGDRLRGAVLANVDTTSPGLEAATAGYEGRVTVLSWDRRDGWTPTTVARDDDRFHHLAAGRPANASDALSLVAVGYSGRVLVVHFGR